MKSFTENGIENELGVELDTTLKEAILKLNQYYDSKGFEYPETGYREIPLYVQLNKPVEKLQAVLELYYRSISEKNK